MLRWVTRHSKVSTESPRYWKKKQSLSMYVMRISLKLWDPCWIGLEITSCCWIVSNTDSGGWVEYTKVKREQCLRNSAKSVSNFGIMIISLYCCVLQHVNWILELGDSDCLIKTQYYANTFIDEYSMIPALCH